MDECKCVTLVRACRFKRFLPSVVNASLFPKHSRGVFLFWPVCRVLYRRAYSTTLLVLVARLLVLLPLSLPFAARVSYCCLCESYRVHATSSSSGIDEADGGKHVLACLTSSNLFYYSGSMMCASQMQSLSHIMYELQLSLQLPELDILLVWHKLSFTSETS